MAELKSVTIDLKQEDDEEEDYMSDAFLKKIPDVRPSLIHRHSRKREFELEAKKKILIEKQRQEKRLRSGEIEKEILQRSLAKPLDQTNKGFQMMARMGYKTGGSLGRQANNDCNTNNEEDSDNHTSASQSQSAEMRLNEPIPLLLKTDRQGLGRESALNEIKQKLQKMREIKLLGSSNNQDLAATITEYRHRLRNKSEEGTILRSLRGCQSFCETLDRESNLEEPRISWFWQQPKVKTETPIEKSPVNNNEDNNGDEDITENESIGKDESLNDDDIDREDDRMDDITNLEKLEILTDYLRETYLLCYWCSIRFNDEKDLVTNCPGPTKDDHLS